MYVVSVTQIFFCLNPFIFASCTDTFSKWCKITRGMKRSDRLCALVFRDLGYRSGSPGSIPSTTRKKIEGLKRGPLSLVSATEVLLDRKAAAPV
jgi:hypothetical protein